jgi:hypothetical protein
VYNFNTQGQKEPKMKTQITNENLTKIMRVGNEFEFACLILAKFTGSTVEEVKLQVRRHLKKDTK